MGNPHHPHPPHHLASGVVPPIGQAILPHNPQTHKKMERGNLTFHETLTIEQFKALQHVDKLQVKQNPKEGSKLFMTYGAKTAAVAAKGIPQAPMVSLVTPEGKTPCFDERRIGSDRTCPTFWLLHEEGTGGAPVVATF